MYTEDTYNFDSSSIGSMHGQSLDDKGEKSKLDIWGVRSLHGESFDDQTGIIKLPLEAPFKNSIRQKKEVVFRENWTDRLDFLVSCIGFAVGFGNIWRFPYLCYMSGGGAFLIPYTIFMLTCSIPLFYLEVAYGQFASLNIIAVWRRICPLFRGVGYGMIIIASFVCIYFNVILAWNFYYLFHSMSTKLPWALCGQSWNTANCMVSSLHINRTQGVHMVLSSAEFWERHVLEMTDGIENFGRIRWPLLGCLLLAWVVVFLCLFRGIKYSGKIVYITATFPYFVLVVLMIRTAMLPGAGEGIKYFIIPTWRKLFHLQVWGDAAVQIFYSMGMSWGSLVNMASYNKFDHNFYSDVIAVPVINCATSIFAGFVIFSTLGFMSNKTGLPIRDVVDYGPGLTFVAYPEAVSLLPFSQLWAIMFFLMIFTVGLDTQFAFFEMITNAFIDEYPDALRKNKTLFTGISCAIAFFMGIPMVFQGGIYLLQIIDWYAAAFSLMLMSMVECVVICWLYGDQRFVKDIELMLGEPPNNGWIYMWKYFTPLIVLYIWTFFLETMEPVSMKSYEFPRWAIYLGWAIGLTSLLPLPISAIIDIQKERTGSIWQRVKKLAQPAYNWGPALVENKIKYLRSMNRYERERFESVFFGLDRDRYLSMRTHNSIDMTNSINVNPVNDVNEYILPLEVSRYFPILSNVQGSDVS